MNKIEKRYPVIFRSLGITLNLKNNFQYHFITTRDVEKYVDRYLRILRNNDFNLASSEMKGAYNTFFIENGDNEKCSSVLDAYKKNRTIDSYVIISSTLEEPTFTFKKAHEESHIVLELLGKKGYAEFLKEKGLTNTHLIEKQDKEIICDIGGIYACSIRRKEVSMEVLTKKNSRRIVSLWNRMDTLSDKLKTSSQIISYYEKK
ncbi:MAG: hypothetical protein WC755_05215 [Candidatus Woesearchaeota archaeon]|jgi:hypothetical protein